MHPPAGLTRVDVLFYLNPIPKFPFLTPKMCLITTSCLTAETFLTEIKFLTMKIQLAKLIGSLIFSKCQQLISSLQAQVEKWQLWKVKFKLKVGEVLLLVLKLTLKVEKGKLLLVKSQLLSEKS